jgi:hypothetical protein
VAVAGLARDCASPLSQNIDRIAGLLDQAGADWRVHVRENDSVDETKLVLEEYAAADSRITFHAEDYGRESLSSEFAGPRTVALADYREACREWVASSEADYVVLIDWDAWGGWSQAGLLTGFARLESHPDAFGMASVSLMEHPLQTYDTTTRTLKRSTHWVHYDCWALRLNCYLDDYSAGVGAWKHQWLPFVGSPPVPVCSAFGGLAVYRWSDFVLGRYDGDDCEHVPFHRSIRQQTGKRLYLNPSQRTVMKWLPEGWADGQEAGGQRDAVQG